MGGLDIEVIFFKNTFKLNASLPTKDKIFLWFSKLHHEVDDLKATFMNQFKLQIFIFNEL